MRNKKYVAVILVLILAAAAAIAYISITPSLPSPDKKGESQSLKNIEFTVPDGWHIESSLSSEDVLRFVTDEKDAVLEISYLGNDESTSEKYENFGIADDIADYLGNDTTYSEKEDTDMNGETYGISLYYSDKNIKNVDETIEEVEKSIKKR